MNNVMHQVDVNEKCELMFLVSFKNETISFVSITI